MTRNRKGRDHFAKRAKKENYPARSVYKLQEIDNKVKLFKSGMSVLDLGAAPGSWSIYVADKVTSSGTVVAIDRAAMTVKFPPHVITIKENALALKPEELLALIKKPGFDAVISDMAPHTSGHRFVDQSRSYNLFMRALELSKQLLNENGHFVGKIFTGEDFDAARNHMRTIFRTVKIIKPKSVRTESYEIYLVGLDKMISSQ